MYKIFKFLKKLRFIKLTNLAIVFEWGFVLRLEKDLQEKF